MRSIERICFDIPLLETTTNYLIGERHPNPKHNELPRSKTRHSVLSSQSKPSIFRRLKDAVRKLIRPRAIEQSPPRSSKLIPTAKSPKVSWSRGSHDTEDAPGVEHSNYAFEKDIQHQRRRDEMLKYVADNRDSCQTAVVKYTSTTGSSEPSLTDTTTLGSSELAVTDPTTLRSPVSNHTEEQSTTELEETLKIYARYGEQVQNDMTISPVLMKQIARDSSVLLKACDEAVMKRLVDQGLLKQLVDTELIRKALNFFRMWVSLESPSGSEPVGPEAPLVVATPQKGD